MEKQRIIDVLYAVNAYIYELISTYQPYSHEDESFEQVFNNCVRKHAKKCKPENFDFNHIKRMEKCVFKQH